MLDNKDFIEWGNENVVLVVGHDGATGSNEPHKPIEEKAKDGTTKQICPLYPGLTCDEHKAVRADVAKGIDGLGKIDVPSGFPNSWMVGPDGAVEKLENKDAGVAKSCQDALTAFQKKFDGKPLLLKKYDDYRKAFADGDKGVEDGKWKVALAAYLKVDADGKKLTKGLVDKVKAKVDAVNAKVVEAFGKVKDDAATDLAAKIKAVKALRADASAKFSTGNLAVLTDLDGWIKENPVPAPAAPPK